MKLFLSNIFILFVLITVPACKKTKHDNPFTSWVGEWELVNYTFDSTKIINSDSQVSHYETLKAEIMNVQSSSYYQVNGTFKNKNHYIEDHSIKYKITTQLTDNDSLIIQEHYEILDNGGKVEFQRNFVNGIRLIKDVEKYGRYWDSLERKEAYHLELRDGSIFYSDRVGRDYLQYYYNDHYGWNRIFTKK